MPIGDYKRTVESHVATTFKLGGTLAFGLTLMEPILATAQPAVTLQVYVAMNEAARRQYDLLYTDLVVTIVMTNGMDVRLLNPPLVLEVSDLLVPYCIHTFCAFIGAIN